MSRRSAEQIMKDNAIPSLHEQATLVRSLARALGQVEWTAKCIREWGSEAPEGDALRRAHLEKSRAKMVRLTDYLRRYGRTWAQREAAGIR